MCLPALLREPDAECAEALLGAQFLRLAERHVLDLGVPALREIPQSLAVWRPTTATRPRPCRISSITATPRLPYQPSASTSGARRLRFSGEHRPVALELSEHEALEGGVLLQKLDARAARSGLPAPPAHPGLQNRQRLRRPDERVPLEELLLLPEQAVELGDVVGAEAAPEDELLWRRDRRDRVDLQEAESPNVSRTFVAEPSRSCARTAMRRASSGETSLTAAPPSRSRRQRTAGLFASRRRTPALGAPPASRRSGSRAGRR